jgi:hypothetical protein
MRFFISWQKGSRLKKRLGIRYNLQVTPPVTYCLYEGHYINFYILSDSSISKRLSIQHIRDISYSSHNIPLLVPTMPMVIS